MIDFMAKAVQVGVNITNKIVIVSRFSEIIRKAIPTIDHSIHDMPTCSFMND